MRDALSMKDVREIHERSTRGERLKNESRSNTFMKQLRMNYDISTREVRNK